MNVFAMRTFNHDLPTGSDSLLKKIIDSSPEERASLLENSRDLEHIYQKAACGGDTVPPDAHDEVDLHYTCFVRNLDGFVYELDGDAEGPTKTGIQLDQEDLLHETILNYIMDWTSKESSPEFSLLALVPNSRG